MPKKIYSEILQYLQMTRDLHNAIFNSFGFDGMEVASFTPCDENMEPGR
jgi:hypothetical protein